MLTSLFERSIAPSHSTHLLYNFTSSLLPRWYVLYKNIELNIYRILLYNGNLLLSVVPKRCMTTSQIDGLKYRGNWFWHLEGSFYMLLYLWWVFYDVLECGGEIFIWTYSICRHHPQDSIRRNTENPGEGNPSLFLVSI